MKVALAVSLVLHVALLWGADFASRTMRRQSIPDEFIVVNLVGAAPSAAKAPGAVAAQPPAAKPATAKPVLKPEPPRKKVPDVALKPRKQQEKKPEEKKTAPAAPPEEEAPAAGLGDVRLDTADFPFAYYLVALRNKISAHWLPAPMPPGASARAAMVYFRIEKDGRVSDAAVETPSGNAFFDRAALRAVLNASPLAPLPPDFPALSLGVHLEFKQTAP